MVSTFALFVMMGVGPGRLGPPGNTSAPCLSLPGSPVLFISPHTHQRPWSDSASGTQVMAGDSGKQGLGLSRPTRMAGLFPFFSHTPGAAWSSTTTPHFDTIRVFPASRPSVFCLVSYATYIYTCTWTRGNFYHHFLTNPIYRKIFRRPRTVYSPH